MNKQQLKPHISDFLKKMMGEWFADKPMLKILGISLIDANINKYDNILDMFANENDDIDIEGVLNNLTSAMEGNIELDLHKLSPLLPNRVLLITKNDITDFMALLNEKEVKS
jgi:hypothetical protein